MESPKRKPYKLKKKTNGHLNGHYNDGIVHDEPMPETTSLPPPVTADPTVVPKQVNLAGITLLIATPCHGGDVWHEYVISLARTQMILASYGVNVMLMILPGESVITKARNALASRFLKTNATHMLFVDADMGWEPDAVLRLLASGRPLCGVAGRRKCEPASYCALLDPAANVGDPSTGLIRAHSVGTGFMLISRDVLEAMALKEPDNFYIDYGSGEKLFNFFENRTHKSHFWSEDYIFCLKWQDCGGEVWVDPASRLKHLGQQVFEGALLDEIQRFGKNFVNHDIVGKVNDILGNNKGKGHETIPSELHGGGYNVPRTPTDIGNNGNVSLPNPIHDQPRL